MAPTPTLPAAAPNLPTALEGSPTTLVGKGIGESVNNPPTLTAEAKAAGIATQQHDGETAQNILKDLASPQSGTPESDQGTIPAAPAGGSIARGVEAAAVPPAIVAEPGSAAIQPLEKSVDTEKIDLLLRDAAKYLVGRHDARFVMVASALAASPQTPLGSELRKNALISLRDLEQRKGPWGLIDKKPQALNAGSSTFVTKEDQPSSIALTGFLDEQLKTLPPETKKSLSLLLEQVRSGDIQASQLIEYFSQQRSYLLKPIAERLHHETTGKEDGWMPTLNNPRGMLIAADIDSFRNRRQLKQMLNQDQVGTLNRIKEALPIGFILFMSFLQMMPQEEKQRPQ